MKLGNLFTGRLPNRQSILGVYAVIVFLVYSWTLFASFYKLPSWMFYLTIGQILSVYAYAFSVDLLESILALAGVFALDLTLFLALRNMEEFQTRSILVVLSVLVSSMLRLILFSNYEKNEAFLSGELTWWAFTFLFTLVIAVIVPKNRWVRKALEVVADRAIVFLYIYLPLSLVSLVTVLIRNIY
jgi:hypothetical protein